MKNCTENDDLKCNKIYHEDMLKKELIREGNRLLKSENGVLWAGKTKIKEIYPIYDIYEKNNYYELKVVLDNGKDSGYILISQKNNTFIIEEFNETGLTYYEQLKQICGKDNFKTIRYSSVYTVAKDESGNIIAEIGPQINRTEFGDNEPELVDLTEGLSIYNTLTRQSNSEIVLADGIENAPLYSQISYKGWYTVNGVTKMYYTGSASQAWMNFLGWHYFNWTQTLFDERINYHKKNYYDRIEKVTGYYSDRYMRELAYYLKTECRYGKSGVDMYNDMLLGYKFISEELRHGILNPCTEVFKAVLQGGSGIDALDALIGVLSDLPVHFDSAAPPIRLSTSYPKMLKEDKRPIIINCNYNTDDYSVAYGMIVSNNMRYYRCYSPYLTYENGKNVIKTNAKWIGEGSITGYYYLKSIDSILNFLYLDNHREFIIDGAKVSPINKSIKIYTGTAVFSCSTVGKGDWHRFFYSFDVGNEINKDYFVKAISRVSLGTIDSRGGETTGIGIDDSFAILNPKTNKIRITMRCVIKGPNSRIMRVSYKVYVFLQEG